MFKEVMNDLWLARISSLLNEVGLYVTKRLPRNRKSKKDRQSNGKMKEDKQGSTKHYTEN
jgi:hypothetical protein